MGTGHAPIRDWLAGVVEREGGPTAFARRIDVSHSTVIRWLDGERVPDSESCRKIARALGLDEDTVLAIAGHRSRPERVTREQLAREAREVLRETQQLNARARMLVERLEEHDQETGVLIGFFGRVPADALRWVRGVRENEPVRVLSEWIGARSPGDLLVVEASGDCLLRQGIADGHYVLIHRLGDRRPRNDQIVLVRIGDEYSLKVWRKLDRFIEFHDGNGHVVHRLSVLDEFEVVGTYVTNWNPVGEPSASGTP